MLFVHRTTLAEFLVAFPSARSLIRADQDHFLRLLNHKAFAVGAVLFAQGQVSDEVFLILSGTIEISALSSTGESIPLGRVSRGEVFGEMGVLDCLPRSATSTAIESVQVLVLTREQYSSLARRGDRLAWWLLDITCVNLARRINEMTERIAAAHMNPEVLRRLPRDPDKRAERWWQVLAGRRSRS